MFLFFLPAILLNTLISTLIPEVGSSLFLILFTGTIILIEYRLFTILEIFKKSTRATWAWLGIFSPLGIYISFVHGQIDIIPALVLTLGASYVLRGEWEKAGFAIGIAIAAKFSFGLVLPFFVVFFMAKRVRKRAALKFVKGLIPGFILLASPIIYSAGYRRMVIGTPEVLETLDAQINIGVSVIYLFPIAYLLVFLVFWNLGQISHFVLVSFLGASLTVIAVTQVGSIGWFYWGLPLILLTLREASSRTLALTWFWQLSVIGFFALQEGSMALRTSIFSGQVLSVNLEVRSFIFTLNIIVGAVIIGKIITEALISGDIYKLSKRPLSITVAGDSGVGKDTLSNEIAGLFGEQEVSLLLGDDYHLYERNDTSWLSTTHLSPDANDLESLGRDFKRLQNRERVLVKHYDHSVGRFSLPRKISPAQVVIVNGLHSQLIPGAELADLRIFMSMDDELRKHLKITRDSVQRDQFDIEMIEKSIARRIPHYQQYVAPQSASADIEFRISATSLDPLRLVVCIRMKDVAFLHEIKTLVNSVTSTPTTVSTRENQIWLEVDPSKFKGEDAYVIVRAKVNSFDQLFPPRPKFSDGSVGFMGMVTVLVLARKRANYA
jgi:uridine kinase